MGKHFWTNHASDDEEFYDKQPGCSMWDLFHRGSNFRKMIHHHDEFAAGTGVTGLPLTCDWSQEISHRVSATYESADEFFDPREAYTPRAKAKRARKSKKRSISARIKSLLAEDFYKENHKKHHQGELRSEPSLRRTYSIHHLEDLHAEINKICTDWRHEPSFVFKNGSADHSLNTMETNDPEARNKHADDVLDIFKVDKQMFMRELQQSSEKLNNFISGLDMAPKKFNPRSQGTVLKPSKLEDKHTEVWMSQKSQATDVKKNFKSLSLNATMGMYTQLLDSSYRTDTKLYSSRSLKLENEYGKGLTYFRRVRSLSNSDSCFSNIKFSIKGTDFTFKDCGFDQQEDTMWYKDNATSENVANVVRNVDEIKRSVVSCRGGTASMFSAEIIDHEQAHLCSMPRPDMAPHVGELQPQGVENRSSLFDEELSFPVSYYDDDQERLLNHPRASYNTSLNLSMNEKLDKTLETTKKKSDLYFVRYLLEKSGIAKPDSEILDKPLSSELFEKVEACWPHGQDELTGLPDFNGCWHHMMLFHLVNEMLANVYDLSLPYYPNPLSHSCHVRPFPSGNYIIKEVSSKVARLINMDPEDQRDPQDYAVVHDLESDSHWMNLQFESECTALELEEVIFDELLEEFISSCGLQVF